VALVGKAGVKSKGIVEIPRERTSRLLSTYYKATTPWGPDPTKTNKIALREEWSRIGSTASRKT
jgi:hypothetical protein